MGQKWAKSRNSGENAKTTHSGVLRSHMPVGKKTETYNRRNIVTFKKDLKIV